MNNPSKWIEQKKKIGWFLLAGGIVAALIGIILPGLVEKLPFNSRIITGLGMMLIALGITNLVRSNALRRDPQTARRVQNEEADERIQSIRAKAGNRAFWVSIVMTYTTLMWLSFAASGSLPEPTPDTLWFILAASVVIPFGVYIVSLVMAQNRE